MRISEAARTVGVRPSAVRFWEQQKLLHPTREPSTGYRRYTPTELSRLNIVALLRDVGYQFDAIREVLDELAGGRPDHIRQALEDRLQTLHRTTDHCMRATATLHTYLQAPDLPDPAAAEGRAAGELDQAGDRDRGVEHGGDRDREVDQAGDGDRGVEHGGDGDREGWRSGAG
jgi:DNA-binding transcriptional MerR regulator